MSAVESTRWPSRWSMFRRLWWKDVRQSRNMAVFIIGTFWLIHVVTVFINHRYSGNSSAQELIWVLVSALGLLAVLVVGIAIGQERSSGTWNTVTNLPVGRWLGLCSVFVTWLVWSSMMIVLQVVTTMIAEIHQLDSLANDWFHFMRPLVFWLALTALGIFWLILLFQLASNESMVGLAWALILFIAIVLIPVYDRQLRIFYSVALLTGALSVLGSVCLFRWRWGVGQYESIFSVFHRLRMSLTPNESVATSSWEQSWSSVMVRPCRLRAQWWLSWRTGAPVIYLVISVTLLSLLMMTMASDQGYKQILQVIISLLLPLLLGLNVFGNDRSRDRFRFLGDRGVSVDQVFWRRWVIHVALLIGLIATEFFLGGLFDLEILVFIAWLSVIVFTMAMISSLFLNSILVSFCFAALISWACLAAIQCGDAVRTELWGLASMPMSQSKLWWLLLVPAVFGMVISRNWLSKLLRFGSLSVWDFAMILGLWITAFFLAGLFQADGLVWYLSLTAIAAAVGVYLYWSELYNAAWSRQKNVR